MISRGYLARSLAHDTKTIGSIVRHRKIYTIELGMSDETFEIMTLNAFIAEGAASNMERQFRHNRGQRSELMWLSVVIKYDAKFDLIHVVESVLYLLH